MGVVYKARQIPLNREVAVKLILDADTVDPTALARFRAEAEVIADLKHPGVVQIHDAGVCDGRPYFVLEFLEGGSLAERTGRVWEPTAAASLVAKLARTVHACHERGIVHRDLKPANILLTAEGEPKVADFGLAKRPEVTALTANGAVLGTPAYMAPEQAAGRLGDVGPATDVYGLGAILYELLTGRPPFEGAAVLDIIRRVASEDPAPPTQFRPELPRDLEVICLKCLQKDSSRRYASALELAQDLERFIGGDPIRGRLPPWPARVARWVKRHPSLATAVGCVAGQSLLYWLWSSLGSHWSLWGGVLILSLLSVTLFQVGVTWFMLRPSRVRTRLLRVALVVASGSMLVVADVAMRPVVLEWVVDGQTLLVMVYSILFSGPVQGIQLGVLCAAVAGCVRWRTGGRLGPTVAGVVIGFWAPVMIIGGLALVFTSDERHGPPDAWLVALVCGVVFAGMVIGSVLGARWGRHEPPLNPAHPTGAA